MSTGACALLGQCLGGKYRLARHIGNGGMAYVFAAERLHIGDLAAVKYLNPELRADELKRRRFQLEAYTTSAVKHPNVVTVYDYDETPAGSPYIVLELLRGCTLSALLKRTRILNTSKVLAVLEPVCMALSLAHQKSILHRDLKPSNIFLHQLEDGTEIIKLIDFGIGKNLNSNDGQITQEGFVVGTPEYLAPERYKGNILDARSDIYSLGILTFRMLIGRVPFTGQNPTEILQKHLKEQVPRPRSLNQNITPEVEEVILRALAKNPDDRFSSCEGFITALRKACISSGETMEHYSVT